MSRRLRLGGLAISGVAGPERWPPAAAAAPVVQPSAASSSGAHGTLTVFGAGTLSTPFTAEIAAFKKQNPGVTIHSQFGASG